MKQNVLLYIYGAIIVLEGVFLLFSKNFTFSVTRYTLGIALVIGAVLALATAFSSQRKQVQFAYHEMHALSMFVYGISVLLFASSIEILGYLTAFLLFFYAFSEVIFCSWIFNLLNSVEVKILLIRVFLALVVGIGTVVLMNYDTVNEKLFIEGYGILFGIMGINTLLYHPIMKPKAMNETEIVYTE